MHLKATLVSVSALGLASSALGAGGLIISEVVDATLSGGNPKFVEITNTGGSDFTFGAGEGLIVEFNGGSDTAVDVDLTGVTIMAGESYVIQSSSNGGQTVFFDTYGFDADLYTTQFLGNGDDWYGISVGGSIIDIYGLVGVDGTGTNWEYLDGYSYRQATAIKGAGMAFNEAEWFFGGVDSLETGDDVEETALIQSLTTPGSHDFIPTPGAAALLGLAGIAAVRRRRA